MNNDGQTRNQTPSPSPQTPQKKTATEEQVHGARGYLRIFVALVLALVLTSGLALPWKLVPLALGVAAVVVGILTLVKVRRYGLGRVPLFVTSLGLVATLVMTAGLGLAVITWDQTQKLESCMASALTMQAQEKCRTDFTSDLLPG